MSNARRCRPPAETWREFSSKFASPINSWQAFERRRRLLAEGWRLDQLMYNCAGEKKEVR